MANYTLKLSIVSELPAGCFSLSFIGYYIPWYPSLLSSRRKKRKTKTDFTETMKVFLYKFERVSNGSRCSLICLKTPAKLDSFAIHCDIVQCSRAKRKRHARLCLLFVRHVVVPGFGRYDTATRAEAEMEEMRGGGEDRAEEVMI